MVVSTPPSDALVELPRSKWNIELDNLTRIWRSRYFTVQEFKYTNHTRLSVSRTEVREDGEFAEGISWDELMEIKRRVGYAEQFAIEIYPEDSQIVNQANMRHIWVLKKPLPLGWRRRAPRNH